MTAQPERPSIPAGSEPVATEPGWLTGPVAARVLPFATYMAFIAIADLLARLGWSDAALRWLYPIKITAVIVVLLAYRRHYSELARGAVRWPAVLAAIAVGIVVLVLWVKLDAPWMQIGVSAGFDPTRSGGELDWVLIALRIAGAALVVPVMEELFWRSFLLRWIARPEFLLVHPATVGLKAFIVTVILFGVEHNLWLAGMVAGVAYNLLYMRTGSLWSAILAHATTNGLLGVWVVATANWAYW